MTSDAVRISDDDGYSITYSIDLNKIAVYARNCIICGNEIILIRGRPHYGLPGM